MGKANKLCALRVFDRFDEICPILSINKLKTKQKSGNAVMRQNTLIFNIQYMKTSLNILSSVSSQEKLRIKDI